MTESKFSFNCYLDHEDGYGGQMTVRGETIEEWAANFDAFAKALVERKYQRSVRTPAVQTGSGSAPTIAKIDTSKNTTNTSLSFDANLLTCSMGENGKLAYKVKGGTFEKWGIPIYPEKLVEAGFDLAGIVAGQSYTLDHTARYEEAPYVKKDGTQGTSRKVVALVGK